MPTLSPPLEPENPQSLVSQLQQVHGLTKKKVYSAKPTRKPFFREERVRRDVPGIQDPLVLPDTKIYSRPIESGRVMSKSKAARISRVTQNSPTEMQGRRPALPRRTSQVSLPESDGHPSSTPYSVQPNTYPTPTSVVPIANVYDQSIVPVQPEQFLESSWYNWQYKSIVPSVPYDHHPTHHNMLSCQSFEDMWKENATNVSRLEPHAMPTQNAGIAYNPPMECFPIEDLSIASHMSNGFANVPSNPPSRRGSCPEDDEPFTFNAEYVAATAALFKSEVLPAYPELQPAFQEEVSPRRAFSIAQDQESMPPSPLSSYCPGELYAATERDEHQYSVSLTQKSNFVVPDSPRLMYATTYSPGSTSSLTGWAG